MSNSIEPKSLKNTRLRILLILCVGIILILLTLSEVISCYLGFDLSTLFLHLGRTFVAASVIALVLRVPSLLNDVNNAAIKLLTSNEFLKRLSVPELAEIRALATTNSYLKAGDAVNESLKKLDEKTAKLFLEPYFKFYNMNIRCKVLDNGNIEKLTSIHFALNNPNKEKCNAFDYYRTRLILEKIEDDIEIRTLESFQVLKDDDLEFKDVTEDYGITLDPYKEESLSYNIVSSIKSKEKSSQLEFKDTIQIKITEKRIVKESDNLFIYRVNNPTEDLSINYSFENCDINLIGTGFGTFQNTKDGGINVFKDGNSIHISSRSWLLPGNGIMIVHNK